MSKQKLVAIGVGFDPEILERLRSMAKDEERSVSQQIRLIVREWLESQPRED